MKKLLSVVAIVGISALLYAEYKSYQKEKSKGLNIKK